MSLRGARTRAAEPWQGHAEPKEAPRAWLDAKHMLVLSIFLDLLSVSLVVPSLPGRYRELGLTGWRFGAMGSVYSATQILGGIVLGFASDRALGRRGLLLLSFAGAAFSYALVATARSLATLVVSRIVVGLTKQSLTAVSALMAEATSASERTAWLAHITCATTLSWAVGTALGGLLSTLSPMLPEIVAVLLYGANALLVIAALPLGAARRGASRAHEQPDTAAPASKRAPPPAARGGLSSSFASVLHDGAVLRVLSVQLTRVLMVRALGSASEMYELDRWSLSTVENGLLRSYKSVAVLGVQVLVMPLLLSRQRNLHALLHVMTVVKVLIDLLEFVPSAALGPLGALPLLPGKLAAHPSLLVYALLCVPVRAVPCQHAARRTLRRAGPRASRAPRRCCAPHRPQARAVCAHAISVSQKALFTMSVAQSEMGAALAVLDVLQSCVGVVAPLLGGAMLGTVPVAYQPLVAAACNALLAVQLLLVYPPPGLLRRVAPRYAARLAARRAESREPGAEAVAAGGGKAAADQDDPAGERPRAAGHSRALRPRGRGRAEESAGGAKGAPAGGSVKAHVE